MRISDWSSDVCSSDLLCRIEQGEGAGRGRRDAELARTVGAGAVRLSGHGPLDHRDGEDVADPGGPGAAGERRIAVRLLGARAGRIGDRLRRRSGALPQFWRQAAIAPPRSGGTWLTGQGPWQA